MYFVIQHEKTFYIRSRITIDLGTLNIKQRKELKHFKALTLVIIFYIILGFQNFDTCYVLSLQDTRRQL